MKFGIDISFWDGVLDFELAKTRLDFVFIKAFEYREDIHFKENWNGSKGKVPRGAYYFWRQSSDSTDKLRTDSFLSLIGGSNYDGELPVVIDLEDSIANRATVYPQIDRLSERIKQTTGRYPIIYTGPNYWATTCASKVTQYWCDVHPLWISAPNIDSHVNFETEYKEILSGIRKPVVPVIPPFKKVDIVQYTFRGKPSDIPGYPTGIGAKKAIDFNLFLGTDQEFATLIKSQVIPPIEYTLEQKVDILWKQYLNK